MDEVREFAVELYGDGLCTAPCLFGKDEVCICRCRGLWHGLIYADEGHVWRWTTGPWDGLVDSIEALTPPGVYDVWRPWTPEALVP